MNEIAQLILDAGRAGIELALFVLLPVMIVMLTLMRLLESRGVLDHVVRLCSPLLKPFGIPGLGIFAMIQVLFVSFAAPVATLAMMDRGGISSRHIAATLALVLTLAQANVVFPMATVGLDVWGTILISLGCGIIAAALTYHLFGRNLSTQEVDQKLDCDHEDGSSLFAVIQRAGKDAFDISIAALPMLVLALVVVYSLRTLGVIEQLEGLLAPLFTSLDLPQQTLLPVLAKYIAGGMAMMGVTVDYINQGLISGTELNRLAGFLIHPMDLAGVAVMMSAGRRVAAVVLPAVLGAICAILLRTLLHVLLF
ncbi:nucleoside recognition domain-containing protein [Motiliproteus sp.]|uniref:nucleoside recognition domain-containing protein n=1 Tax=Motiliproteus sp. TaxID=1898955 RepID=UPI003BA928B2